MALAISLRDEAYFFLVFLLIGRYHYGNREGNGIGIGTVGLVESCRVGLSFS